MGHPASDAREVRAAGPPDLRAMMPHLTAAPPNPPIAPLDMRDPPPEVVSAMSEVLPDGLVVMDHDAVIRFANHRAGHILDLDVRALIGRPVREALPLRDNDGRSWWDLADPWHSLHTVTGHREKLLWTESGVELLITGKYLRASRRGSVQRILMSVRDASARQRAEQDHAALISTIAHELRSPLTSVKGFSTTLLRSWDKFTDEQKRFMIQTIEADADRVTRLITELLDVSRLDAGRLDVRLQPVDLGAFAERHIDRLVATNIPRERFVVEIADDLPEVWADPDRMSQIFSNLLENATRHGAGTVTVKIMRARPGSAGDAATGASSPRSGAEPDVLVTVADEGEGVPDAHRSLIFGRFWHGTRRGSTGLGLYIVKGLVEAHGGRINVRPAPGGGAEFWFRLPSGAPEHLL